MRMLINLLIYQFDVLPFFIPSVDSLGHNIPVFFHYYNIFCYSRYLPSPSRLPLKTLSSLSLSSSIPVPPLTSSRKTCSSGERMKWSIVICLLQLNVLLVGAALFSSDAPPLITCARAAAWAAAINFGYASLGLLSPIFRLIYQLCNFNIMHYSLRAIHFHRNAATSGI